LRCNKYCHFCKGWNLFNNHII